MPNDRESYLEPTREPRGDATVRENDDILNEYVAAVEIVRRVRDMASQAIRPGVRHLLLPASRVSADFFCSAEHPRLGWFCLLADTIGPGLPAAIFTLHTPLLFHESVMLGMSLPGIYTRINRFLQQQRTAGYFVSGFLVRVQDREVEVINAGMPDALLLADDGRLAEAFPSRCIPFGIEANDDGRDVDLQRYRLARDERASLLLHSDGLSALDIRSGGVFRHDGLLKIAGSGAEPIFERLVGRITAQAENLRDDVSLVMIPLPLAPPLQNAREPALNELTPMPNLTDHFSRRIVESLDFGLILTDFDQRILYVNPKFCDVTGYSSDEVIGQTPRLLKSGRQDPAFYREMWQTIRERGRWTGEIWNRRKDGTIYLEWASILALNDDEGKPANFLAIFTVIAEKNAREGRLHFLAQHDPMTGLPNRILLADRASQAIRCANRAERSLAVLLIDLDRFKSVNDSLGYDVGDEVLVRVANVLQGVLRDVDTLSRYGGDEFVCLLPDIADRHDASLVANKLLAALENPIEVAGHYFKIGASIGISVYPSDGKDFDDLLVRADRAMQRAKLAGGNMSKPFSSEMAVSMERQLEIEARLDAAIRNGHLELFYQPKVDLASRRILGAEALVRWRDPERGLISPGDFIPVAERSDLIAKIGNWVLAEACSMLARRGGSLPEDFHVAVNVSPLQFERYDLASEVIRAVSAAGIPPRRLQLEVTESLMIRDAIRVSTMLARIVDFGVLVALDDFGTGYSNLGSLSRLPFDAFKLDQSFVREIDRDTVKASIAKSVRQLAEGLDKKVVAEGIETCGECVKVMELGYRIGQGYRFGKPMPEKEFFALVEQWTPARCVCPPGAHARVSFA